MNYSSVFVECGSSSQLVVQLFNVNIDNKRDTMQVVGDKNKSEVQS